VAAKNRRHGTRNPIACAGDELTADDVLAHDVLAWPLTGPMVARPASGAAAVVLASGRLRRRLGGWPVRVRASVLAAGAPIDDVAARAVTLAYRLAGLGPDDLDCAEVHDDSAAAELGSYEALGLVPAGHGPELIDSGFTALGGVLPVNPSGGLLALGEADGATALAQICELAAQLRGDAGPRQVPAARVALALGLGPDEEHGDRRVAGVALLTAT
jgi:acetyl-CoA acetyltransferase